jgi:hypothetical protein
MAETNGQEMWLKMMSKLEELGGKFDKNQIETKQEFQDMGKQIEQKLESLHNEMQEFQKVRGESQEESETVPEKPSEKEVPTNPKVSSAKQRRIRKLRLLKSLGIKVSKFRKRQ